jgi:histidinol-phosphate phosphatase family protein
MNIAIIGTAYPFRGGLAAYNEKLARELQNAGHTVTIHTFTTQYPNFLFPGKTQYLEEEGPKDLKIQRSFSSINPFSWISLGNKLKKEKPDLVIIRFWLPFMGPSFGSILRRIKKNKHTTIISLVDNMIPHEKRMGDKPFTKYFVKPVDGFLAMSQNVMDDIHQFDKKKPRVLSPHPLFDNFGEILPREKALVELNLSIENQYILFFGLIRKYKGLDLLIEAFADKRFRETNIKVIIAGEYYSDKKEYEDLIAKHNLQDHIIQIDKFIPDSEVKTFFSAADLVVQPYRNATQSGVTQIAYHFNKPMVVTDVGGLAEQCPNGVVGYVVPTDSKAIADAMLTFFLETDKNKMIQNIQEEKKKYGWDILVKNILELKEKIRPTSHSDETSGIHFLKEIDKTWTLFLDRDGVINKRLMGDYVKNVDEFEFLPGVLEAIAAFSKKFGRIIIVTNQQGIGRGIMTENDLKLVHDHMVRQVEKHGGRIYAVYYAPQLASENSNMRKPEIGMAMKAKEDFPEIDFTKSLMIGDSMSDIEFGEKAGMKTLFIDHEKKKPKEVICLSSLEELRMKFED